MRRGSGCAALGVVRRCWAAPSSQLSGFGEGPRRARFGTFMASIHRLWGSDGAARRLRLGCLRGSARHLQRVGAAALGVPLTTPEAPDTPLGGPLHHPWSPPLGA